MEPRIATVSQINGYVKKILDSNILLNDIWIKGEISNFKLHYSGHMYITLKDEGGVLKAVMFKSAAMRLPFMPEDGMKVLARGRISVYEAGGAYQLYINEMVPDGVGELYIAYEQMKKRLEAEGLFDEEFKKPIPLYPKAVGVITAPTGAAVRDIIHVITRRFPMAEIIIYPSLVQGAGAAENICAGIAYFNAHPMADTLIVGRGGGSIEDLWAFNEESVARAIFASEIPVISAVGHETDFTIADFVADLRAPTPSAAAEMSVPARLELAGRLATIESRICNGIRQIIETRRLKAGRLVLPDITEDIMDRAQYIDGLVKRLEQRLKLRMATGREESGKLAAKLDAMSPLKVMARGFAIPTDRNGAVIKTVKRLESGMEFELRFVDGKADCAVK